MAAQNHFDLVQKLSDGIARLTSSDERQRFLDYQSRFHSFSFGNVLLIAAQFPQATQVAGFRAWQRMNRYVLKGSKAIWILAPMIYKRSGDEAAEDAEDRVIRGFKYVPVFDVSQTDGEELPSTCNRLTGDGPAGVYSQLVALANSIGFSVHDHDFGAGGPNGDCSHTEHRIRVEVANAPAQRVKTLTHELAHALVHEKYDDRSLAELEAESTAYLVCQTLGLDSGDYSFGYVATWAASGEKAAAGIKASGERIQRTAASILAAFEPSEESAA